MPATCSWFFPHFFSMLSLFSSEGSETKTVDVASTVFLFFGRMLSVPIVSHRGKIGDVGSLSEGAGTAKP